MDSLRSSLAKLNLSKEEWRVRRPGEATVGAGGPRLLTIPGHSLVSWLIRVDALKTALTRAWRDEFAFSICPVGTGT